MFFLLLLELDKLFFSPEEVSAHVPTLLVLADAPARNRTVTTLDEYSVAVGVENLKVLIVEPVAFKCQHI